MAIDFNLPQDCKQWKDLGINKSDIYPVNPDDGGESFQVSYNTSFYIVYTGIGIL